LGNRVSFRIAGKRKTVGVLLVKHEIARQIDVTVAFHRVRAQARHHRLEVGLIGEAMARFVDDNRMGAEHFTDPDKAKQG
jgi:hypothetical protein